MKRFSIGLVVVLAGCASTPTGPGVLVLPGTGKSFDQFRLDEHECRQYAHAQVGGSTADQAAADAGVKSAVVGTAVGTVAGAALGGHHGAGVGAGVGLAAGALAGTGAAESSSRRLQQRYDFGYQQCMYAKGHKIPMARHEAARYRNAPPPPPPPPDYRVN
ncbi:MAG: hypothetical protein A3G28_00770 [Betaproteobacteria bacterium RIFCSPLOWO2_12_FULL_68_19]|nr:MAG: hypothetical protein A3G28_00770 [Betaproteobacteria bacterium RIFCSPLOWO2_12_FULL_68_19]